MNSTPNHTDIKISQDMLSFIESSPSCFHVIHNISTLLSDHGYQELKENCAWTLNKEGRYFTTRNGSSLLAFQIPKQDYSSFQIIASHCDSPCFKIKEQAEMESDKAFIQLNVEKYGGMLCAPWMDRPLSIAGRVMILTDSGIETRLVHIDRDLVLIPNLAIHMNREVNNGYAYNPQTDMLPLFGQIEAKGTYLPLIAEAAQAEERQLLGTDLFLYNRDKGSIWGACNEFVSAPRLDDLQCVFASACAFLSSSNKQSIPVLAVLDNEEVGSSTKQGAASTFLKDTLERIHTAMGKNRESYHMALADSFMLSADNAHSVHPNHPSKSDPVNRPYLNQGIVIKYNANQKYTTDAVSAAVFKQICHMAQVPVQTFANRSDFAGGSTLGNISATQVPLNTVDIGLAQLAMHSPYETAGVRDTAYLIRAARQFYSCSLTWKGNQIHIN